MPAEAKKKATTMQDSEHTAYYKKPAKQVKQKKRIARLLEPQYDFHNLAKSITKGCKVGQFYTFRIKLEKEGQPYWAVLKYDINK